MGNNLSKPHSITLENRKKMLLSGIVEVVSSLDKCIIAKTAENLLSVSGSGLRVEKLSLEEGTLIISGMVESFKYMPLSSSKSFFKRLFK